MNEENLIKYYNKFNEEKRLDSKHNNDCICVISSEKGNLEELWHEDFFEWLEG